MTEIYAMQLRDTAKELTNRLGRKYNSETVKKLVEDGHLDIVKYGTERHNVIPVESIELYISSQLEDKQPETEDHPQDEAPDPDRIDKLERSINWLKRRLRDLSPYVVSLYNELNEDQIKACRGCGGIMSHEEFGKNRTESDGRGGWCKQCFREYRQSRLKLVSSNDPS